MTQEQAYEEFYALMPEDRRSFLQAERSRAVGCDHGYKNEYYLWDHSQQGPAIVAYSTRSWEHALAIARSGNEDIWPEDDPAWDDEVKAEPSSAAVGNS